MTTRTYPDIPDSIEQHRERTIDAEGESSACSDGDCGCHRAARFLRDELDYREAHEAEEAAREAEQQAINEATIARAEARLNERWDAAR
jgi:hypothetical protein